MWINDAALAGTFISALAFLLLDYMMCEILIQKVKESYCTLLLSAVNIIIH